MTYFERHNLRQTGRHDFEMNCPYCATGGLRVCVDPGLLGTEVEFEFWGIEMDGRCEPGCSCPLPDVTIGRIERECCRRAQVPTRQQHRAALKKNRKL